MRGEIKVKEGARKGGQASKIKEIIACSQM